MIKQKVLALRRQKYALLLLNSKGNEEETNQIRKRAGEKLSSLPGCIQCYDGKKGTVCIVRDFHPFH